MINGLACDGITDTDAVSPGLLRCWCRRDRTRWTKANALQVRVGLDDVEVFWRCRRSRRRRRIGELILDSSPSGRASPHQLDVKRRRQQADIDRVFALLAHFFGELHPPRRTPRNQ